MPKPNMQTICKQYAQYAQNMLKICRNMLNMQTRCSTCKKNAKTFRKYEENIQKICRKYEKKQAEIC